ncbi:MAG TPA: response regulator [Candidatus Acidoferrum sp.]|jgi:CheY-like chemotaxis protein|nr:response regulator [Candidatus Acidoferrum sp.]
MSRLSDSKPNPWHGATEVFHRKLIALWLSPALRVGLVVFSLGFWCARPVYAAETNSSGLEMPLITGNDLEREWLLQHARETQEGYRVRVKLTADAVAGNAPAVAFAKGSTRPPTFAPGGLSRDLWLVAILGIVVLLAIRRLAPELMQSVSSPANPSALAPWAPAASSPQDRAEQKAFAEFLVAFKAGPKASTHTAPLVDPFPAPQVSAGAGGELPKTPPDPLKDFFALAPAHLLAARNVLQEIGRGPEMVARQKLLGDLCGEVRILKGMAGLPELIPAWQLAACLESLLKQLIAQPGRVTPSTLRTVATGADVLWEVCQPGLKADFFTNPPLRFLAVDDDPISRHAVAFSLKKAFTLPDVAASGEAALALASEHAYDAIFLDVLMPGMDGFELCSKIHQTPLNRTSPVVFITCLTDFEARAKSSLSGGTDLLGKPFLTFEITLKALTLTMRARLQARGEAATPAGEGKALTPVHSAKASEEIPA